MTQLDDLDQLASQAFDGYLVQKDLAQKFRGQYPVPTYVGEFLLGRYCATTDPDEIAAGLDMVQKSMQERTVRAGEGELFKHRARDKGRVKILDLLLRSVGFAPERFTPRQQDSLLLRMVPFVVNNYNAVELGPRGTGKSHLFQQVSPYAHLVSGGKATIANMFVNMNTGRRGLVAQYDVICFDEVSGVSFDTKEGVNILKGYMESGEFSRGKESIRAEGGIVMVGNFDVDVDEELRNGHLFGPMPKEMSDETAFHDRIHAYLPGRDAPKLDPSYFTTHFGFVSDFLAECWSQLRRVSRLDVTQGRVQWGRELSGRDRKAANNT